MISKTLVEADLVELDVLYNTGLTHPNPNEAIYFSKLGVLELTGWIEESFDVIARRAIKQELTTQKFKNIAKNAIDKNYGFTFDNNFMTMMQRLIGVGECERLHEWLASDGTLVALRAELDAVLDQRRKAAHVHLAQTALAFDAPSVSLGRLRIVYPIFREIYSYFCN
jgi:hypothetical protein